MDEDDFSLCVLHNARKAARAVSRHYDRLAREAGFTAAQFSVLVAVRQQAGQTTAELAERLSMERTTLVRNMALIERNGLVRSYPSAEGRAKCYRLTDQGEALLQSALPHWRKAQADVRTLLGDGDFRAGISLLKKLSEI